MSTQVNLSETLLWQSLQKCELFVPLAEDDRSAFLKEYRQGGGMRVRSFDAGEPICAKGKYELDLCVVLKGEVGFYDDVTDSGRACVDKREAPGFYGELGAIGGLPRSTDVLANTDCQILYVPGSSLKFIARNENSRRILEDRYKERLIRVLAEQLDIFQGVSKEFVDVLIPHCEIRRYDVGGVQFIRQGDSADSFFIIRDGWVQIDRDDGHGRRILAYRGPNEYIGEMALFLADQQRGANATTAGKCELVSIPYVDFKHLLEKYPHTNQSVRDTIEKRRDAERKVTPELEARLERWGQKKLIQNEALLVMDLDLCVKCDSCVKACESLHGESRLVRTGIQLDSFLVPSACSHCDDPKCMSSCPTGAVKRRPEGEIYFEYDLCIGCGNCALACPYDNIAMIESHKFDAAQLHKERILHRDLFRPFPVTPHSDVEPSLLSKLFGRTEPVAREVSAAPAAGSHAVPPSYPIKCDLCDGLPFMGCVHNCPTSAAIRIEPHVLFEKTGAITVRHRVEKTEKPQRHKYPRATLLAVTCSLILIIVAASAPLVMSNSGPIGSGIWALTGFALAGMYGIRKRSLWASARSLQKVNIALGHRLGVFGRTLQSSLSWIDRLDTWRYGHIALGVIATLLLWWHIYSTPLPPNLIEWSLMATIVLLFISGMLGVVIQDFFPPIAAKQREHNVRIKDIASQLHVLLTEAKDKSVGHGDGIFMAYRELIEPILYQHQSALRLLWATLRNQDPAEWSCADAKQDLGKFGSENPAYEGLVQLAERKVRLEQNRVNLQFTTGWLPYHIGLALLVGFLLIFHIIGALIFRQL